MSLDLGSHYGRRSGFRVVPGFCPWVYVAIKTIVLVPALSLVVPGLCAFGLLFLGSVGDNTDLLVHALPMGLGPCVVTRSIHNI